MQKVVNKIKPSPQEEKKVQKIVDEFIKKLNQHSSPGKIFIGGSFAKGTWLKGNHDIDIFVQYPTNEDLSIHLQTALKKVFKKFEQIHGSRDYFLINFKGLHFEIVPVFKITKPEEAQNVTDVSPLHVEWVKTNLKQRQDEVRLAKQFAKAQNIYGAETYRKGFAGYVLEILIVYYGSFENLLKQSLTWEDNMVIDITHHGNIEDKNKLSVLNVVDPVQSTRNAAAALSKEKVELFKEAAQKYLLNPSEEFFTEKRIKLQELKKQYNIILEALPVKGKDDVIGTKLLKAFEHCTIALEKEGYIPKKSSWFWEKNAYFCYNLSKVSLAKTILHIGPPIERKEDCKRFQEKYKKYTIHADHGRLLVNLPRAYPTLKQFLNAAIRDQYIKERVKKIKILHFKI
ncbi:CCA tRNA nucleotidyltransferase [Candidatus Woesearchaeota archaeon]|nr:CCA tRNA nucleotidyltransferase [Candidatus Woesearchaeota archaeon]